ncbi:hypothetical protein IGI04_035978 [Brassica rapa subsp. trilocularis]|uniref:Uncharacterized protein n=1 Tax=Brassica rapa subsp. trilocularis TaxID=1813537 RepID=A0ABQ7LG83_BRACM|nr:hypothetical protein IGI04_035978 [Brassica rapa subsp. trilocularis]
MILFWNHAFRNLRYTEASSDVRFLLRDRNQNWNLTESRFQNTSKILSLKTRWKLMILFWNHAFVL